MYPETESRTDTTDYLQLTGIPSSESNTDPGGHVELPDMHDTSSSTDPVESTPAEPERVEIHITGEFDSLICALNVEIRQNKKMV